MGEKIILKGKDYLHMSECIVSRKLSQSYKIMLIIWSNDLFRGVQIHPNAKSYLFHYQSF